MQIKYVVWTAEPVLSTKIANFLYAKGSLHPCKSLDHDLA